MPNPLVGMIGASAGSSILQSRAASQAANAQVAGANAGIAEQRRQFDMIRQLVAPWVTAGTGALGGQLDLLGQNGAEKQAAAIAALEASPQMAALTQQGENAILQNASATGGLRGGNTQGALAQFRPQVLSSLIADQYANLGGLSSQGLGAAGGVGQAGQTMANNVTNLYGQIGQAQAGAALARGQAFGGLASGIGSVFGSMIPAPAAGAGIIPAGQTMFSRWGLGF